MLENKSEQYFSRREFHYDLTAGYFFEITDYKAILTKVYHKMIQKPRRKKYATGYYQDAHRYLKNKILYRLQYILMCKSRWALVFNLSDKSF